MDKSIYKGQIIRFSVDGVYDFVGELETKDHPSGSNWFRINEACEIAVREDPQKKTINRIISRIWGEQKDTRHWVDIRVPKDATIRITEVDPKGNFYAVYKQEINRVEADLIKMPNAADLHMVSRSN